MSYYSDLDDDLGASEEAEWWIRDHERNQRQKKKSFDSAVAAEVSRQMRKLTIQNLPQVAYDPSPKVQEKPKPVSRGVMLDRICKCCKKSFKARKADVDRGWGLYCSKRCKAIKQEVDTGGQYRRYIGSLSW